MIYFVFRAHVSWKQFWFPQKHRHLNLILVSMNECACARWEIEGLYFNAFVSVSELFIVTDRKI